MHEKRRWPRWACLERCEVLPFTPGASVQSSRIINYSHTGVLLESDAPLRKGESISIELTSMSQDAILATLMQHIGKVRWCSRQTEHYSAMFHIGIDMTGALRK